MYPAAQIQTHITAFMEVSSGTERAKKKYTLQQAEGLFWYGNGKLYAKFMYSSPVIPLLKLLLAVHNEHPHYKMTLLIIPWHKMTYDGILLWQCQI